MIRNVKPQDVPAITAIYNEYIKNTTIIFDTEPFEESEVAERVDDYSKNHAFFVYEEDNKILGFCYSHPWKAKKAYRFTEETTVYLASGQTGKGIGKKLMEVLIDDCRKRGVKALIACITEGNLISFALHERLEFKRVSHFQKVGWKFNQWLNVFDYELVLDDQ